MNNESGSALQKANFALLVFIAGALAYLIVRERIRARDELVALAAARNDGPVAAVTVPPKPADNPRSNQTSFAPLRPRPVTNSARVNVGKSLVAPVNNTSTLGSGRVANLPARSADVPEAVPAATTPSTFVPEGSTRGTAAAITGRVKLNGTPPVEKRVSLDPLCSQLHPAPMFTRHFVVGRESGLANVFVYVKAGAPKDESQQPSMPVLDNIACEFQPYVMGVRVNQPFEIRNSDTVLHNAHITPNRIENREANLALPLRGQSVRRTFPAPEVFVRIKCDVHPWMFAYLGVLKHRWFAVTDNDGNFALPAGLPPGQYTIAAVHLKAGESMQEINVTEGAPASLSFTLDVPPALAQSGPQ